MNCGTIFSTTKITRCYCRDSNLVHFNFCLMKLPLLLSTEQPCMSNQGQLSWSPSPWTNQSRKRIYRSGQPTLLGWGTNILYGCFLEKEYVKMKELGWESAHTTPESANVSGRIQGAPHVSTEKCLRRRSTPPTSGSAVECSHISWLISYKKISSPFQIWFPWILRRLGWVLLSPCWYQRYTSEYEGTGIRQTNPAVNYSC